MKLAQFVLLVVLLTNGFAHSKEREASSTKAPVEVMILGTFHMAGSDRNVVKTDVKDVLADQAQMEIEDVLDRLEAFAPHKIMVEVNLARAQEFNEQYRSYLDGSYELSANETNQIGMQLAARLGHENLFAVDHSVGLNFGPAIDAAERRGQSGLISTIKQLPEEISEYSKPLVQKSILDQLIAYNSPSTLHANEFYLAIAQMGTPEQPDGAVEIAKWWERNLVIFARIAQYASPGERVLVIYGAGHKYQLEQNFEEAIGFTLVDPLDYLR